MHPTPCPLGHPKAVEALEQQLLEKTKEAAEWRGMAKKMKVVSDNWAASAVWMDVFSAVAAACCPQPVIVGILYCHLCTRL